MLVKLALLTIPSANAKQVMFNKQSEQKQTNFQYQWEDINEQQQSLNFTLDNRSLFSNFRGFKTYTPELAATYTNKKVRRALRKNRLDGVSVNFSKRSDQFTLTSLDPDALKVAEQEIRKLEASYFQEYLTSNYYHRFQTHREESGIKPDHVRIAAESVELFRPFRELILDIVGVKDVRKVSNYILGFVQSIPYSTLESRLTSSGAGYSVPTRLIWENQGDCDSKMTLAATMMRAVMPRIDLIFVYLDNHAMLGIGVEPLAGENYVRVNGNVYVLADPTGPRLMNLGTLSFDNEQAIKSNLFTAESFEKSLIDETNELDETSD